MAACHHANITNIGLPDGDRCSKARRNLERHDDLRVD
jgi:hypothetical protein